MKILRLFPLLAIITLASCDGMFPFNDDITKKDVYGEWRPVQFEVDGVRTEPTVEQRDDFIRFNEDKTFVCQEKTIVVEGEWYFMPLDNSINIMPEEDPNNCIPLRVQSVDEDEMVYKMETGNGDHMTIWLVK
ncbi:MAG: hypothetical protein QF371_00020 [Flavobacteriales bacterium]|jgi:hypothetical protein|nr:hypothetical protein [Flavobacteriales bacterium]